MPKKPGWSELPCPMCKEPAAADALRCPHCQADYTPEQRERRTKEQKTKLGCAGLIVFGLAFSVWLCTSGSSTPLVPEKAEAGAKADAIALVKQVFETTRLCDEASRRAARAMSGKDAMMTLRSVREARSACLPVRSSLEKIEVPASLGKQIHGDASSAIEVCQAAYTSRWAAFDNLAKVLDGEGKPSNMLEIEDAASDGQKQLLACSGGLISAATQAGASLKELGLE